MSCKHKSSIWVLEVAQAVIVTSLAPIICCSIIVLFCKLSWQCLGSESKHKSSVKSNESERYTDWPGDGKGNKTGIYGPLLFVEYDKPGYV